MAIEDYRCVPITSVRAAVLEFASDKANGAVLQLAFRARAVESVLLSLYGAGKLHGTIHTCLGQELVGMILGANLQLDDFVTSNHRGHGHFIGVTANWRGLIDEIAGNADGVCRGVGGSQHLCDSRFLSNGQQGGLVPVAAGVALDRKRRGSQALAISFIGEGTLGEGIVYETMNIASLWRLPLLIICENNYYSQTTPQTHNLAGSICDRASAFGLATYRACTWFPSELAGVFETAIRAVREGSGPAFIQVETYRLSPHSKGDDYRDAGELSDFAARDPLNILLAEEKFNTFYAEILEETRAYAEDAVLKPKLTIQKYTAPPAIANIQTNFKASNEDRPDEYFARSINRFYTDLMTANDKVIFMGEDISDPSGGAFKITAGLASKYPDRVISTPISEAAIVGVGVGLAISGNRPIVEIMFGDFMTFTFDQIINNASKIRFMYNRQLECPLIVRSPMGGRRGYGPTHSQSLEKHFIGIGDTIALSLHTLLSPHAQLEALNNISQTIIIFENKIDYANRIFVCPGAYHIELAGNIFPTALIRPRDRRPTLTVLSYGGMARLIADNLLEIFRRTDFVLELVIPTAIFPIEIDPILQSVKHTGRLATIEEGTLFGGIGAEVVAEITRLSPKPIACTRIGAEYYPIPSEPSLESFVLPSLQKICAKLIEFKGGQFS